MRPFYYCDSFFSIPNVKEGWPKPKPEGGLGKEEEKKEYEEWEGEREWM